MRSVRSISCALFLLTLAAVPASAQSITFPASAPLFSTTEQSGSTARPQSRGGFWFSGGLGVGSLGCEECDEREQPPSEEGGPTLTTGQRAPVHDREVQPDHCGYRLGGSYPNLYEGHGGRANPGR